MNQLLTPTFDELLTENEELQTQLEKAQKTNKFNDAEAIRYVVDKASELVGIKYGKSPIGIKRLERDAKVELIELFETLSYEVQRGEL